LQRSTARRRGASAGGRRRALGEGVYRILRHESGGGRRCATLTHLVYKLELPARGDGEPQEALDVEPEASFRGRRGRLPRAAEQAPRGVPGTPAGRVREPAVRAGGPAGPAQLRGVRAADRRGVGRRGGGARAGVGGGGGGGGEGGQPGEEEEQRAAAAACPPSLYQLRWMSW